MEPIKRPDTPRPEFMEPLPSPISPRQYDSSGNVHDPCQAHRQEALAKSLTFTSWLDCPRCKTTHQAITHQSMGFTLCNGCDDPICSNCLMGARYFCPVRGILEPPIGPLVRQLTLGVQPLQLEEKKENK